MAIGAVISEYISRLGCTAKALAEASGVSQIQLSRWRSETRRPSAEALSKLAGGIASLSGGSIDRREAEEALLAALPTVQRETDGMGARLDLLLRSLRIHTSELARVLNFDPSYLSRIRSGKRRPANTDGIVERVSRFILRRSASDEERVLLADLIGADAQDLEGEDGVTALSDWLRGGEMKNARRLADMGGFFDVLDTFNLQDYISALRLEEAETEEPLPTLPLRETGLRSMMRCELDFLRITARGESREPVLIYTDMPLAEMAKDPDFPKRWMTELARLIKLGIPVRMIHNVNRPMEEMLLGLEIQIPIYMTGRILPYYLKEGSSGPFRHLLEVSGSVALSGEAIAGHHTEGCYYLTDDPDDLRYYHARAAALMEKATPLMEIYTEDEEATLRAFLHDEAKHGHTSTPLQTPAFRNLTVEVCHDRWALVSKDHAPRIFFVIRHPKLVDAIEHFAAPLVDE